MYLHSLELQAFGAFAGTERIDFGALGASGIFLLEGPTGSGKSTLIDAIVFALYGGVAGSVASERRTRSDFADGTTPTVVDLVLETGDGVYRVRRTPAYERPKQRGEGTTTQQASIRLWHLPAAATELNGAPHETLDAVGELLSNRMDEAGGRLREAIGLSREQFVQTIVLPQGEFAAFLHARPEDRTRVLQQVFQTDIYVDAQDALRERRRLAGAAVDAAQGAVTAAMHALAEYEPVTPDDDDAGETASDANADAASDADDAASDLVDGPAQRREALASADDPVELGRAWEAAAQVAARAAEKIESADEARSAAAERALREATERSLRIARRDAARARAATLEEQAPHIAQTQQRLERASGAAAVQPFRDREQVATAALTAMHTAAVAARAATEEFVTDERADELPTQREAYAAELPVLEAIEARAAGLRERTSRGVTDEKGLAAARVAVEEAKAVLAGLPARHTALTQRQHDVEPLATAVSQREHDRDQALRERDELDQLVTRLAAWRAGSATAAATHTAAQQATDLEHARRTARLRGMAGELAVDLTAGDPCPVCGAVEHPHPAELGADHISGEDVAEAEDARKVAEQAHHDAHGQLAAARAGVEEGASRAGLELTVLTGADTPAADALVAEARKSVQARVVNTEAELAAAARASADLKVITEQLTALHDEERAATAALQSAQAIQIQLASSVAAQEERRNEDEAALRADLRALAERHGRELSDDEPSPNIADWADDTAAVLRETVTERLTAIDRLIGAQTQLAQAEHEAQVRTDEVLDALAQHDFADVTALAAAVIPAPERAVLQAEIASHEAAWAQVTAELALPDLNDLPDTLDVDLATLEEARTHASAVAAASRTTAGKRRAHVLAIAGAVRALARAVADHQAAVSGQEVLLRVCDLVTARSTDNSRALTLATYVLVQRFESVVEAANSRLTIMSDGRYELVRSDEREKRGGRNLGLALRVIDHTTGKTREPSSLSGGETFYFALCLALGLADIVMAEAGGIEFGTLFIDEGFGSLDAEKLDVVMAEIVRLRESGRVVGLVSHVDTLKQMIAERVSVRRLASGASTLNVIV